MLGGSEKNGFSTGIIVGSKKNVAVFSFGDRGVDSVKEGRGGKSR